MSKSLISLVIKMYNKVFKDERRFLLVDLESDLASSSEEERALDRETATALLDYYSGLQRAAATARREGPKTS